MLCVCRVECRLHTPPLPILHTPQAYPHPLRDITHIHTPGSSHLRGEASLQQSCPPMCLIFSFLASTHVRQLATAAAANEQMPSPLTHSCVTCLWHTAHHWGDLSEPGMFTFGAFHNSSTSYHFYEVPIFVVSTAHPYRCSLEALVLGLCDTHTRWGRGPWSLLGVQLMGIAGGLIGAVFNALNKRLTMYFAHTHTGHHCPTALPSSFWPNSVCVALFVLAA